MSSGAHALLAKMWEGGLLAHHLTGAGETFLTMQDGTRIELTQDENNLFYLCVDHAGVLAVGDTRCARCTGAALLAKLEQQR